MGMVVDERVKGLRDSATRQLQQAGDYISDSARREHAVEGRARTVLGSGHAQGDHIIADMVQAIACCGRARSAISVALSEVRQINIMMRVPDDDG